jgi:hypothetical protein
VVLRAIGPSLEAFGVNGALQDPKLELHDASGALLDSNDNWQDGLDANEIIADEVAPTDPREIRHRRPDRARAPTPRASQALLVNNTTGIVLEEKYPLSLSRRRNAANIFLPAASILTLSPPPINSSQ